MQSEKNQNRKEWKPVKDISPTKEHLQPNEIQFF